MNAQNSAIYSSEKLRVSAALFEDDAIFVTFQSAVGVGLETPGFGADFFKSRCVSAISMVPLNAAWYQYSDIEYACAAIRAVTSKYNRVITYGISMGGYAAINFAHLVGATDVISISPQHTIDPRRAPAENRYNRAFPRMDGFIYDQPSGRDWSGIDAFVFFDPKVELDLYQINLMADEIPATYVRLWHSTHPCTQVIGIETLKNFLLDSHRLSVRGATTRLISEYKKDRANSWLYWLNLARNHGRYSARRALGFAMMADKLQPENIDVLHTIASLNLALRKVDEALLIFDRCLSLDPNHSPSLEGRAAALIAFA